MDGNVFGIMKISGYAYVGQWSSNTYTCAVLKLCNFKHYGYKSYIIFLNSFRSHETKAIYEYEMFAIAHNESTRIYYPASAVYG